MSEGKTIFNMTAWLGADITEFQSKMKLAQSGTDIFKNTLKDLKNTIVGAFAVGSVVEFGKSCMEAYDKEIKAEAGLKNALNGRLDVYQELKSFAEDWQYKGVHSKEEIITEEKYLSALGFTKDKIEETISASLQLSQVTGGSLDESVKGLTKSYSGTLSKELARIPALKELSSEELKHGAAIEYVLKNMKGFEEVAGSSGLSGITHLKEAWEDLKVAMGELTGPALSKGAETITATLRALGDEGLTAGQKIKFFLLHPLMDVLGNTKSTYEAMRKEAEDKRPKVNQSIFGGSMNDAIGKVPDLNEKKSIIEQIKADINDIVKLQSETTSLTLLAQYNEELKKERDYLSAIEKITPQDLADRKNPLTPIKPIDVTQTKGVDQWGTGVASAIPNAVSTPNFKGISGTIDQAGNDALKHAHDLMHDLNLTINEGLKALGVALFEGIGKALWAAISSGDISAAFRQMGAVLLGGFANILIEMGTMLIAEGMGIKAFKTAIEHMDAVTAITAGAALIVIGGLFSGIAQSIGSSSNPTEGISAEGSYVASSTNLPHSSGSSLAGYNTQAINVNVHGEIAGNKLVLLTDRARTIRDQSF
jgi:hypothetical protein